jgi:DNA-binding NarL/FixJ family response regulator
MASIKVVIADDHPVVRLGIRAMLERAEDIRVIGEAINGSEALQLVKQLTPDVLLLDMEMPDMEGSEVAQKLNDEKANVRILALSAHEDRYYIQQLLSNGASGYLVKDEVPETIIDAVRGVYHGEQGWVSRRIAALMTTWVSDSDEADDELSDRETEVLRWMVAGHTNLEIAQELGISQKTVEKHLDSIYTKLKVVSRVEAAVRAIKEGLV